MSAERQGDEEQLDSDHHHDGRDELKSMLDTISAQLQDADRRQMSALNDMQDRIAGMEREADAMRAHVPDEFAPAFAQIETAIDQLAQRLAGAGQRRAPASWDRSSADALAGLYDASGSVYPGNIAHAGDEGAGSSSRVDEAWLESRFADIARGIEDSLAHMKPESGVSDLGERFDQFERQFAKLFAGVATHDDLAAVREIGSHMEEVVGHLEYTHGQLERLTTIEAQIATISQTLAEMQKPSHASSTPEIDAIARAVAEETAQRFASTQHRDGSSADTLRPLIEQLMAENRQGGEQTAMQLDTIQQAMVRLLDRVDAFDYPPPPIPRVFESGASHYSAGTDMFGGEPGRDDISVGAAPSGAAVPPPLAFAHETEASPEDLARRSEMLRQEFVADARRAKMRLSGHGDELSAVPPASVDANLSRVPPISPAGSRPIRPSARVTKNASGPSAPSPRLILVAVLVLIALAGIWYTLGFAGGERSEPVAVQQIAPAAQSAPSGVTETQKSAPAGDQSKPSAPPQDVNGPRGDVAPGGDERVRDTASIDAPAAPRTALPMMGVAVDLDQPTSQAEVEQARRHQAMAAMSARLGGEMAQPGESPQVPAKMVPTEAETEGVASNDRGGADPATMTRSAPLDLPAPTIGPLSLRLAAAKGDPSAAFEVGARYAQGDGVTQNFKEAAKWYQRSADQGFAQAQYRLGTLYERGFGLKTDREQAALWYQRAAEQGNIKAMHNLAVLSTNQTDRAPDYTSAARWFGEAAKYGLPDSQFNLAILYENGLGVKADMAQAFMWLSIAARNGDADAIRRCEIIRSKLSAAEMADAKRMIAAWRPAPADRTINDARTAGEQWKKNPRNGVAG
ncbi:MAG: sel1 repeat family protein [Hyphomicrobium sp.]